jgi:NADH dehydrogenase/NADH:ubiquinone oxidoreductase subunit G
VPQVTIDGRSISVEPGVTILQAARSLGIEVPTLCYHPAVEPTGSCRLCSVELTQGSRVRLVTACNFPIEEDGLAVKTDSPRVRHARRWVLELLLARAPDAEVLQRLAR